MKRTYFLIFSVFACMFGCKAQEAKPITTVEEFDRKLTQIYVKSGFPGFSLAIVKKDEIIYQKAFGYADLENKIPFTTHTIQPVGSVSKTCIALALMKAIEQGHFTLETNINDILPFKVINPFFPGKPIQVKHLATHTSGIADRESAYKQTYVYEKIPDTDLSAFLFEYLGNTGKLYDKENFVDSEPGATYRYTNIGAALAAYLIEVKTGESFAVYTRKEIFNPLQMNDTHWLYDDTKADKYAKLYNVNKQAYPPYALITYPDGGMRTSSGDLAKYMMEMLKGYSNNSNLLTTQSFTTMFSPQFNEGNMPKNMPANEPNRGVFWAFSRSGRIAHSGGDPGVSAFVSFDPKSQVGRLILINTEIEESKKMTEHFSAIVQILQNFESHLQ